jgi:cell division protein FtsB
MAFIKHIRFRLMQALGPVALMTLLFYLGYHAVNGNYGLKALRELDGSLETISLQAMAAHETRLALEIKVARLRPDNLDPELLGERAREVLGFLRSDEVVVLMGE